MRSVVIILVALITSVVASPTKVERAAPAGATIDGSCSPIGKVGCQGTAVTKCGHAGLFIFPCGTGTHCELVAPDDPTCVAD